MSPTEQNEEKMRERHGHRNDSKGGDLITDTVKGAIAGAIGVWALDKVTWAMWDRTDPAKLRQEEQEARPRGMDPAHVMANEAAEAMGMQLTPKQPHPAGIAVHYGLGVMPGAAYGALRHKVPALTAGGGMSGDRTSRREVLRETRETAARWNARPEADTLGS